MAGMGVQEFSDVIEYDNSEPFVRATGLMESEYQGAWIYVGLVQLSGNPGDDNREVTGAAYGLGPVSMRDAWDANGRVRNNESLMSEWNMVLQRDVDNPTFQDGPAYGFVMVQKAGGGFAGWVDVTVKMQAKTANADAAAIESNGSGTAPTTVRRAATKSGS
jgi:hypothetical protein